MNESQTEALRIYTEGRENTLRVNAYQALAFAHQEIGQILADWGAAGPEAILRVARSVAAHIAEAASEAGALKALKDVQPCVAVEPVTTREANHG